MFVFEYAERFKHLISFHTLKIDEEWQCRNSENVLWRDIKLMVADLCIKELFALVERGKMLVKMKSDVDKQQGQ